MKITNALLLSSLFVLGAQAATTDTTPGSSSSSSISGTEAMTPDVRCSKLLDANVKSKSNEDLGKLEDLLVDPQTGEIKFAILGRGGFLGIGEKLVPVPWQAINVKSEKEFTLSVDKEKLKTAPTTDKGYANLQDPAYTVTIYRFYEIPATGGSQGPGGSETGTSSSTSTNSSGSIK